MGIHRKFIIDAIWDSTWNFGGLMAMPAMLSNESKESLPWRSWASAFLMLIHVDPCWSSFLFFSDVFMIFITISITIVIVWIPAFLQPEVFFQRRQDLTAAISACEAASRWQSAAGLLGSMKSHGLVTSRWALLDWHPISSDDTFGWPRKGTLSEWFFRMAFALLCALSESLNFEGTKLKHLQQCSGRLRDTQLGICWHGVIVWYRRSHKGLFRNQVTAFRSCRNSQILMFALHWCFGKESWQMGAGCRDPGLSRAWIDHLQLCRSVVGWKVSKGFKRHFVSLCFTVPSFVMTLWDFLAASRGLEILRNMHAATLAPLALHPPALGRDV